MEAPQRRWNDALEKAITRQSSPLHSRIFLSIVLARSGPKAAVQAFLDRKAIF
jgi:hypothetical protein